MRASVLKPRASSLLRMRNWSVDCGQLSVGSWQWHGAAESASGSRCRCRTNAAHALSSGQVASDATPPAPPCEGGEPGRGRGWRIEDGGWRGSLDAVQALLRSLRKMGRLDAIST